MLSIEDHRSWSQPPWIWIVAPLLLGYMTLVSYLTSLCFAFYFSKIRITVPSSQGSLRIKRANISNMLKWMCATYKALALVIIIGKSAWRKAHLGFQTGWIRSKPSYFWPTEAKQPDFWKTWNFKSFLKNISLWVKWSKYGVEQWQLWENLCN